LEAAVPDRPDPIARFRDLFARACHGPADATAVVLATAGADGPRARYVLLKSVDEGGFVFFTNYRSPKARELAARPEAALCVSWPWTGVEVDVEGDVEVLAADPSDAYFATRPRVSQLGAWASKQSAALSSPLVLLLRVAAFGLRFLGRRVPRPPHWGGFRLRPRQITFREEERAEAGSTLRVYVRTEDGWRRCPDEVRLALGRWP
jgi:pyridoxamine 5'-phosphate oxidase